MNSSRKSCRAFRCLFCLAGWLCLISLLPGGIAFGDQVDDLINLFAQDAAGLDERLAAIRILGDIGDDRAVPLLAEKVRDADVQIRFASIHSLGRIGSGPAREVLTDLQSQGSGEISRGALVGLAMARDPAAFTRSETLLASEDWQDRWYGILALDILGDEKAAPLFENALTDPYQLPEGGRYPVRESAQSALDRLRSSVHWLHSLAEGYAISAETKKPLFLYFYINGGEWCERLDKESFSDSRVRDLLNRFVPVRVNAYIERGLSEKYGVEGTPAMIVLDSHGQEFSRYPGYLVRDGLIEYLDDMLMAMEDHTEASGLWIKAQSLIDQGRFREAVPILESFLNQPAQGPFQAKLENARFMLALAYGKSGSYEKSKEGLEKFIRDYPQSEYMDKVLYCLGLAELHLKDYEKAKQTLTDLIARFPQSSVISEAQSLMNQLP